MPPEGYDIADPTPADDVIDKQERVEAVIDHEIDEAKAKGSTLNRGTLDSTTHAAGTSSTTYCEFSTITDGHGDAISASGSNISVEKGVWACTVWLYASYTGLSAADRVFVTLGDNNSPTFVCQAALPMKAGAGFVEGSVSSTYYLPDYNGVPDTLSVGVITPVALTGMTVRVTLVQLAAG